MIKLFATISKPKLDKQLLLLDKMTKDAIVKGLVFSATSIHGDVVKSIHSLSGNSKPAKRNGRSVMVSPPGAPPNTDLGDLARSYQFSVDKKRLSVVIGSNLKKAVGLEFGVKKINLAPRPHLGPALKKNKKHIPPEFKTRLNVNLKKVGKK